MNKNMPIALTLLFVSACVQANGTVPQDSLDAYNVVWDSPSENALGSMPLGNGDIGINAWVEPSGDLVFYVSKTDAWDENHRLCKVGRIRVKFDPALATTPRFRQELKLRDGVIEISGSVSDKPVAIRLWVDANEPVVRVEADSEVPVKCRAEVEIWRLKERPFTKETDGLSGETLEKHPSQPVVLPDTVEPNPGDRVVWYHRNTRSCYPLSLEQQHLQDLAGKFPDPLLNHTFGASLLGQGLKAAGERVIESEKPARHHSLSVVVLAQQTPTAKAWVDKLEALEKAATMRSPDDSRKATAAWWADFWKRSWVFASSSSDTAAGEVTRGYLLQRFMLACSGRGASPIKFNGSIFNVEPVPGASPETDGDKSGNPDWRPWGGDYWFQNTRLCYWPLLATGDFEMIEPLFRMYQQALPLSKERMKRYYGFEETAQFAETIKFWGLTQFQAFGWGNKGTEPTSGYLRYYWNGNLELVTLMLEHYAFTGDEAFARETLLPLAVPLLAFYDQFWKERDAEGKIRFAPSQSLETFWDNTVNPMPEIAGLHYVLPRLLALPENLVGAQQRTRWTKLLQMLPPVPVQRINGQQELIKRARPQKEKDKLSGKKSDIVNLANHPFTKLNGEELLVPAAEIQGYAHNWENPELYCIFPYRLFGVGKADLELARRTYQFRIRTLNFCWCQDSIQAALLGLSDQAATQVAKRAMQRHKQQRFIAMWGPGYDATPDTDHGANLMTTVQYMLLQTDGGKIRILPAWPKNWDVSFRLHGANKTVVECVYRGGKIEKLRVTPEERRRDLILPEFK